ncbi:hypothetical protein OG339_48655 (plasmid) [Streptosporangium sp. NBC_01495]|uniref:DUF6879 family protein n=1 Tax=Streptosporangium sp. NBC_01495 TaxID=2903899 RepID=UPI002E354329|nr:DUF6879 family protein [Streptosporangium sp. NBC_01495]
MLDPADPFPVPPQGKKLVRKAYRRDFQERDALIRNHDSWKFERRQHFEEQGSPSRDAFRRGDWEEALQLLNERREDLLALTREDERRGSFFHRVRVVETPLTPYMRWELHSLRIRAECGERIRVVGVEKVAALEKVDLLPEVVILGGRTLYHVLYTTTGVPDGAVRYTDPDFIASWEKYIRSLYEAGEDVISYFDHQ